jgi:hypothetical protein
VRRSGRIGASDAQIFAADESADAQKAAGLTGAGPIAAVETILALQGVEDSAGGHARGLAQGDQLLRLLDEVRDGLLAGGIPKLTLNRLALAVAKRRESFAEPKLQTILDEIDLRARVELAKLEQAERFAA